MYKLSGVTAGLLAISPVAAFDPIKGGVNVLLVSHFTEGVACHRHKQASTFCVSQSH